MKLKEYLKQNNKRPADLAHDLKIVHCVVRRWCNGESIPTKDYMKKIFEYTDGMVTPNDFYHVQKEKTVS